MPTPVNTQTSSDFGGTSYTDFSIAALSVTAGNFLVVGFRAYKGSSYTAATSITDTAGNTYTLVGMSPSATGTNQAYVEMWYAENISGNASNVITIHWPASVQYVGAVVAQYSGVATSSSLDGFAVSASGTGAVSTVTSGTLTTANADDLLVGVVDIDATGGTWTPSSSPSSWTNRVQDAQAVTMLQDLVVAATVSQTFSVTSIQNQAMAFVVAGFKAASGGGGGGGNPWYAYAQM